jgi:hypothetical protein
MEREYGRELGTRKPGRLHDRKAELPRAGLDCRLADDAARGGPVRLGDDTDEVEDALFTQPIERVEGRHREGRRSEKDDARC